MSYKALDIYGIIKAQKTRSTKHKISQNPQKTRVNPLGTLERQHIVQTGVKISGPGNARLLRYLHLKNGPKYLIFSQILGLICICRSKKPKVLILI